MEKYTAFDPKTEVIGYTMTSFLDCVTHTEVVPIVRAHGIETIDPDRWYPQQLWLDILTDIVHQPNAMENLVAVGMKLAEKIIFPLRLQRSKKHLPEAVWLTRRITEMAIQATLYTRMPGQHVCF
jgi:hypothetical protein